jgi:hypothetical protein
VICTFESFLERMTPELPNCPEPLISQKLVNAARVFAARTDSLRRTLRVPARDNQVRYVLEPDFCADVLKLERVKVGELEMPDLVWMFAEAEEEGECPTLSFLPEAWPYLRSGERIEARAILAPKTDSTEAPAEWLDRWNEGIVGYAMQDLMGMEGVPWSRPNRAAIYAGRFQSEVHRARQAARALRGHERARGIGA